MIDAPAAPAVKRRTQGARVVRFIEQHCVHPDGRWIGQRFTLQPWQKELIYALFETEPNGLRRYRWALIGTPKKNGKTTLTAALGLYFLLGDGEPSPLVVCAAASEDQADLVFDAAKRMCELSPTLSQVTERYEREILVPSSPGARLKRLAAVAGANDGQNISAALLDELHEWTGPKSEAVWNILTNGTGARRQPMVLQISTAGHDKQTILGRQYDYGRKVESGELQDRRYFFRWWQAPEELDYRDPAAWRAANPSFGVTVDAEFFEDQLTKKQQAVFERYFLDRWTAAAEAWLPHGAWDACQAPELDLDPALPLRVGIDLSARRDATAVVCAQRRGERVVVRARAWSNPYPEGHSLHGGWRLNLVEVKNHLRELWHRFPEPTAEIDGELFDGPEFSYDPWSFRESAAELTGEGLAMVEYPQHDSRMIPACSSLFELVSNQRLAHDGDPVLARHVAAAIAEQKPRGWRLSKPKGSRVQIDAVIACAIAAYRALEPAPERSIYEEPGAMAL